MKKVSEKSASEIFGFGAYGNHCLGILLCIDYCGIRRLDGADLIMLET